MADYVPLSRSATVVGSPISRLVGQRLVAVAYHFLPPADGGKYADGELEADSDLSVVLLDFDDGERITITWALDGDYGGLAAGWGEGRPPGFGAGVLDASQRPVWRDILNERFVRSPRVGRNPASSVRRRSGRCDWVSSRGVQSCSRWGRVTLRGRNSCPTNWWCWLMITSRVRIGPHTCRVVRGGFDQLTSSGGRANGDATVDIRRPTGKIERIHIRLGSTT